MYKYCLATLLIVSMFCVLPWIGCTPTMPSPNGNQNGANDNANDNGDADTVVPIDGGGALAFPPGALPANAEVTVSAAKATPNLPLGVELLGEPISIEIDDAVTRPLTIRLPFPAEADADRLGIYQIASDGSTTLLSTEVDGNLLTAATDHFTITPDPPQGSAKSQPRMGFPELDALAAAIGLRQEQGPVPDISPPRQATIVGPNFLAPSQTALFSLTGLEEFTGDQLDIEWNLYGDGAGLATPSGADSSNGIAVLFASRSVRVDVADDAPPGRLDLSCSYVDPASGTRGFATRALSVQSEETVGDLTLLYLGGDTEAVVGQPHSGFAIGVLNPQGPTVSFDWDFGTGDIGGQGGQGNISLTLGTGNYTYDQAGTFTFTAQATALDGSTGQIDIPVTVRESALQILITGDLVVDPIPSPFATRDFTVQIENGLPPYSLVRSILPGGVSDPVEVNGSSYTIMTQLNEPGSYVMSVTVTDANGDSATFTRPITVRNVDTPLFFSFAAAIDVAEPGETISFPFSVQGGGLVANGMRQDTYTLDIDWGDGESSTLGVESLGSLTTVSDAIAHSFREGGDLTVEATLTDAVGGSVTRTATVTIATSCPNPCNTPADCVAIDAGAACLENCCYECDDDGDCAGELVCNLETLACEEPCTFCCENDGICDTGADCPTDSDCALCGADEGGVCVAGCDPPDLDCFATINITAEGSVSSSSVFSPDFLVSNAVDGTTGSNWFSDGSTGGNSEVFSWTYFGEGNTSITRIETDAETFEGGGAFGFESAQVIILAADGTQVFASDGIGLAAYRVDLSVDAPAGTEGKTVQIILVNHQEPSCGGFSEFRVFSRRLIEQAPE